MCGIFAYAGPRKDTAEIILEGLKALEYRGYDSWGIAVGVGDDIAIEKQIGKIGEAHTTLPSSQLGIGHTRWATHGGVTQLNAHPHVDDSGKVAVVHNGIVENYQEIKADLTALGHSFVSETDSEVVAHLIGEKMEKMDFKKALCESFSEIAGSNALCVLNNKTEEVGVCRDGSPIVIGIGEDEYFVGSDVTAFLPYTKKVVFLDDGQGAIISSRGFSVFDVKTGKELDPVITVIDWELEEAQKGGYSHYLIKEIMEQVSTIPKTAHLNDALMEKSADLIKKAERVMITGCGTAGFCGLAATYLFSKFGIRAEFFGAYESGPALSFVNGKTVLIAISQSGETADILITVKKAKAQGATVVAVINARGSTLERIADISLMVGSGPEIAVISTKAFTAQLATLYRLAALCEGSKHGEKEVVEVGTALTQWLSDETLEKVKALSQDIYLRDHLYIIGKDLQYPAALECGLKIKETSYIHAEAFAAGELKHGVIALIEQGTPCIVLGANDEYVHELRASAAEMRARGGRIIGVAPFEAPEFDVHMKTPDLGMLTLIPNIIVGQLLGYYCALGRGADPDKPRNLAKSVTVK